MSLFSPCRACLDELAYPKISGSTCSPLPAMIMTLNANIISLKSCRHQKLHVILSTDFSHWQNLVIMRIFCPRRFSLIHPSISKVPCTLNTIIFEEDPTLWRTRNKTCFRTIKYLLPERNQWPYKKPCTYNLVNNLQTCRAYNVLKIKFQ